MLDATSSLLENLPEKSRSVQHSPVAMYTIPADVSEEDQEDEEEEEYDEDDMDDMDEMDEMDNMKFGQHGGYMDYETVQV